MRLLRYGLPMLATLGALAVLVAGDASAQESSATGLMAKANERYERGGYAEATQQYEALIDRGYSDAALYFNLGNAYLESGDLGRAILNYLRARRLSPRDTDIRDNLESGPWNDRGPHRHRARLPGGKCIVLRPPVGYPRRAWDSWRSSCGLLLG